MCGKGWRCIHKAVHTQGGAHIRWSVATAGVFLFHGGSRNGPTRDRGRLKFQHMQQIRAWGMGRICEGAVGPASVMDDTRLC